MKTEHYIFMFGFAAIVIAIILNSHQWQYPEDIPDGEYMDWWEWNARRTLASGL